MNISKRYAWQSVVNCRENSPLLPQSLREGGGGGGGGGWLLERVDVEKTTVIFNLFPQPSWLDYNHNIWKEPSPARVQDPQERLQGWIE